jgi:hypothetical protein
MLTDAGPKKVWFGVQWSGGTLEDYQALLTEIGERLPRARFMMKNPFNPVFDPDTVHYLGFTLLALGYYATKKGIDTTAKALLLILKHKLKLKEAKVLRPKPGRAKKKSPPRKPKKKKGGAGGAGSDGCGTF